MRTRQLLITAILLALGLGASSIAEAKDKKKPERGMLESMQSVPCGAKERGVTGLGSIFGSVGVEHVNSHEQLCPQYLLRTDEMDYHIRPVDLKHAEVLPVGQEAVFKLEKGQLMLRVKDGDKKDGDKSKYKKEQPFQVVSMEPAKSGNGVESTNYKPAEKPAEPTHPEAQADRVDGNKVSNGNGNTNSAVSGQTSDPPPQPQNQ
jgi:hypothetical protein